MPDFSKVEATAVAPDMTMLGAYVPLPPSSVLPINAFVLHAEQPVLVDTGFAALGSSFMESLRSVIDPRDLRWLWLSHLDPDHLGNYGQVLSEAPRLRVVTSFMGMGGLGLMQLPADRVYLLNPGQSLDIGDRRLHAFRPATYDSPMATGFVDSKTRVMFSVDSFGALLAGPAAGANDADEAELRNGVIAWATIDAPWLSMVDPGRFARSLAEVRRMEPSIILSSHLPPAKGMTDTLLSHLDAARLAPPFVGQDQAALESMLSAGSTAGR